MDYLVNLIILLAELMTKALMRKYTLPSKDLEKGPSPSSYLRISLPFLRHCEIPLSTTLLVAPVYYLVVPYFECSRVSQRRPQSRALPLVGPTPYARTRNRLSITHQLAKAHVPRVTGEPSEGHQSVLQLQRSAVGLVSFFRLT